MNIETALERIKTAVGPCGWIADPAEQEPYLVEARRLWRGATRLVVRPVSTEEVAAVVRICADAKLPIVPQGGNTGLVGGGVPPEDGQNIVLALGRMSRIRAVDPRAASGQRPERRRALRQTSLESPGFRPRDSA